MIDSGILEPDCMVAFLHPVGSNGPVANPAYIVLKNALRNEFRIGPLSQQLHRQIMIKLLEEALHAVEPDNKGDWALPDLRRHIIGNPLFLNNEYKEHFNFDQRKAKSKLCLHGGSMGKDLQWCETTMTRNAPRRRATHTVDRTTRLVVARP